MSGRLARWLPGLAAIVAADAATRRRDVFAGVVLSALLVPAGMGYAQAAGLEPVFGLYATIVPLLVYAVVGPSPVLVFGPDSSLAPLIAAVVLPAAAGDPSKAIAYAGMLAIVSGAISVAAGVARLGFLADLLSLPVRVGFLNGIALTVLVAQVPRLLGFSTEGDTVWAGFRGIVDGIGDGRVDSTAVALGAGALAIILLGRFVRVGVPWMAVALGAAMIAVALFDLDERGIALVGALPRGLPSLSWPGVPWSDMDTIAAAAFGIALVSFADTSVLSRSFAARRDVDVDPNQELVALGLVHVVSGVTQGFAVSASSSRTPVAEAAGARTQLAGVVGALGIVVLIVAAPGVFRYLPTAALAAVVIAAALRLMSWRPVVWLARQRRSEALTSLVAFVGVVVWGPLWGIAIAVVVSLLLFVRRAWRPHSASLVRVDGLKGYHDAERHPEGRAVPGLLLYRFDAPLFFANGGLFRDQILHLARVNPTPVRWVVVTAEPITDIDATAMEALDELVRELSARGVVLGFAELKGRVREQLDRAGLLERIGPEHVWRTTGQAVRAYVAATGTPWVDWQDRKRAAHDDDDLPIDAD